MNVDISPNLPPSSSCTAAAPTGSGSDGGGSSVEQPIDAQDHSFSFEEVEGVKRKTRSAQR